MANILVRRNQSNITPQGIVRYRRLSRLFVEIFQTDLLAQTVDQLGSFGLRQFLIECCGLLGLFGKRFQVRSLCAGHRLGTGDPIIRVLFGI
jgi:hypothetical protein